MTQPSQKRTQQNTLKRPGGIGGVLRKSQSEGPLSFCSGGKVSSQVGFVVAGPHVFALPHPKHSLPVLKTMPRIGKTEAQDRFAEPIYGYCAMPKKPLIPYDPMASRSKTAHLDAEFRIPSRNASQIQFDSGANFGGGMRRTTPLSSYQSDFIGMPVDRRQNAGMRANSLKIMKEKAGAP
jgi:hypothetical protein